MIKIAFAINYIVKNGPSSVVLNIMENLNKSQYDVTLITLFDGNDPVVIEKLKEDRVHIYECKTLTRLKCLFGYGNEFSHVIEHGRFDVVHTHGIMPDILSSKLRGQAKRITTIHNNMFEDYLTTYGYVKSKVFVYLHIKALRRLDQCCCCAKSVYEVMKKRISNASYIRNGIMITHERTTISREKLGIPEKARVFLYAGGLTQGKNVVWLINSFVQCHSDNEYLLVLGDGEKEAECKSIADKHVMMLGFQNDVEAYMKTSDIYVSASKSEGFSISVLEALSCGMGLLLSDIPSHREVLEMESNVYLGEVFSWDGFSKAIEKLRMSEFNRERIVDFQRKMLSAKSMTEGYEAEYR